MCWIKWVRLFKERCFWTESWLSLIMPALSRHPGVLSRDPELSIKPQAFTIIPALAFARINFRGDQYLTA